MNVTQYPVEQATPETYSTPESPIDSRYYRGWQGALKLGQQVLSLLSFVIMVANLCGACSVKYAATYRFFCFVTFFAFLTTLMLHMVLLHKIHERVLQTQRLVWPIVFLAYYAVIVILYFAASIAVAVHSSKQCNLAGRQAAAAFGFFCVIAYVPSLIFAIKGFIDAFREEKSMKPQPHTNPSPDKSATLPTSSTIPAQSVPSSGIYDNAPDFNKV